MSASEISAIVQAASAVVIVLLTGALAWTAWNALKASREQATSASEATAEMQRQRDEMRRQTVLAALPMLRVQPPWPDVDVERSLLTYLDLANTARTPVLGLHLEIRTEDQVGQPGDHAYGRHELSMLVPEMSVQIAVESSELFDMKFDWTAAQSIQARGERPPYYHSERLLFDFRYRTPLGAEIRQRYRWYPNLQPAADETATWTLIQVTVSPDPADPQDIIDVQLSL
jgi:hypothetical protein